MNEIIQNKLIEKGWNIEQFNGKLTIYQRDEHGNKNPETAYICDSAGVYCYYQGDFKRLYSFGTFEENFIGLYCLTEQEYGKIRPQLYNDINKISESENIEEITEIYLKYIDEQYIANNLNMDMNITKDNSFNLIYNGKWFELKYNIGNSQTTIVGAKKINYIYADALPYLMMKKTFEEKILPNININALTSRNILDFYNVYSRGSQLKIEDLQENKTRK